MAGEASGQAHPGKAQFQGPPTGAHFSSPQIAPLAVDQSFKTKPVADPSYSNHTRAGAGDVQVTAICGLTEAL